jgi:C-terminal processing protease CtpA/Prc
MERCVLLAFLLAALAPAADFTGRWRAALNGGGHTGEVELELRQHGDTVSGTIWLSGEPRAIAPSKVEGGRASLILLIPRDGKLARVETAVRLEGDRLFFAEGADGSARRVQPEPSGRTDRLTGLFRLWGAIKFFHPWLAYKAVDWDAALLAAIPHAENAATRERYAAAVSGMLAALDDPATRLLPDAAAAPAAERNPLPSRRILRQGYYPQNPRHPSFYYRDWDVRENAGPQVYVLDLPYGLRAAMRTAETVPPTAPAELDQAEQRYEGALPDRLHRLLALARLWSVIRYFFPYHDLMERSWDSLAAEAIPAFETAETWRDYVFAIARLGAHLRDGHVNVGRFWEELGASPAIEVKPVEGRPVVTHAGGLAGVEAGDVILAVDGEDPAVRLRKFQELQSHATPQAAALWACRHLLAGREPRVRVRLLKADGRETESVLDRTVPVVPRRPRQGPVYRLLPEGFGYIDLTRLENGEATRALDLVSAAPGLILDLRGYPTQAHAEVAARLTERRVARAIVELTEWRGPDPAEARRHRYWQQGWLGNRPPYRGKVAVLIDADAASAAEHACLYFDTAARATFIGSPTAGTNGDVTNTVLPGNIEFAFTGLAVRHADGRQLQRVGVQPHVRAEPTIAGIRAGRDEVLERAVEYLSRP